MSQNIHCCSTAPCSQTPHRGRNYCLSKPSRHQCSLLRIHKYQDSLLGMSNAHYLLCNPNYHHRQNIPLCLLAQYILDRQRMNGTSKMQALQLLRAHPKQTMRLCQCRESSIPQQHNAPCKKWDTLPLCLSRPSPGPHQGKRENPSFHHCTQVRMFHLHVHKYLGCSLIPEAHRKKGMVECNPVDLLRQDV
jgi:hypothetical protein